MLFLVGEEVDTMSSQVSCDKKCSGAAKNVELGGDGFNFYVVSFSVKKGRGKIQKATVELGTKDISIFNISKNLSFSFSLSISPIPGFHHDARFWVGYARDHAPPASYHATHATGWIWFWHATHATGWVRIWRRLCLWIPQSLPRDVRPVSLLQHARLS